MHANKSNIMRESPFLFVIAAAVLLLLAALPVYGEGGSGLADRALKKRAAEVTAMRNDFVAKVLLQEHIPYKVNDAGAVVLIQMDGNWEIVEKIEIVPELRSDEQEADPAAHELYLTTTGGVYRIVSDIAVRK